MVVGVAHRPVMLPAVLALVQRVAPASSHGHPWAHGPGAACTQSGLARPAPGSPPPLHGVTCAEHSLRCAAYKAPAAVRLDDLGREQGGQGHPTGGRSGPCGVAPRWCPPTATMAQPSRAILLEARAQTPGPTAWGAHADDGGHPHLSQGQGARAASERQEPGAVRV